MLGLLQCLAWGLDASKGMFKLQMMQQASETGAGFDLQGRQQAIAVCLLYTSPSPRDVEESRMPSSA